MKRIVIGFSIVIVAGLTAYIASESPVIGLAAAIVTLIILPPSVDPAIQIKEQQMSHIQPEMRPGPKTWKLGNKEAGTGEVLKALRTNRDGTPLCPNCGEPSLLQGPSGGMSMNAACGSCLHEFNLGMFDSPPLVMEARGRMDMSRASVFGISPEEYAANPNSGWEKVS